VRLRDVCLGEGQRLARTKAGICEHGDERSVPGSHGGSDHLDLGWPRSTGSLFCDFLLGRVAILIGFFDAQPHASALMNMDPSSSRIGTVFHRDSGVP